MTEFFRVGDSLVMLRVNSAIASAQRRSLDHSHYAMTLRALLALHVSAGTADRTAQLGARFAITTAALNGALVRNLVRIEFCSFIIDSLGHDAGKSSISQVPFP